MKILRQQNNQGNYMALLQSLLTTIFVIVCFILIFIILLQKGKGGTGLFSNMGNANVKLFGGSGGQDIFQKATWVLAFLFMSGSLILALMKNSTTGSSSRLAQDLPEITIKSEPAESMADQE